MDFRLFKGNNKNNNEIEKEKSNDTIPTEGLYFALIGNIDAEVISDDSYINRGEYPTHYTVVRKLENTDAYVDLFENIGYEFRDESKEKTILKMYSFQPRKSFTSKEYLESILEAYKRVLVEDSKVKPGDGQVYIRKRRID